MKQLLILAMVLGVVSCRLDDSEIETVTKYSDGDINFDGHWDKDVVEHRVVIAGDCLWVVFYSNSNDGVAIDAEHSPTCTNPCHLEHD